MGEGILKMAIYLPEEVKSIIDTLEKNGFEAFAVGGCVRDSLLGITPNDWDITTDALPEDIKRIFHVTIDTGIAHGTVTVRKNRTNFEVTTYRTDGKYEDGRHPTEVTFVRDLKEDLRRRDFTINAMAYNDSAGIVDKYNGLEDLKNRVIRCVEDPNKRFSEDALRMLRAVRFSAQLGFEIEKETKDSIRELASNLSNISAERICDEFIKLICSDRPDMLKLMGELNLTSVFFPEWDEMMKTTQNTKHHRGTVGEHTLFVMEEVPPKKHLRLAALLHDIGKPICKKTDSKGGDHFVGHPQVGAELSKSFMKRLKLDNDTINYVTRLVRFHDDRPNLNKRTVRRCLNRMGEDIFPDVFILRKADVMGQSSYKREQKLEEIDLFRKYYEEIIKDKECFSLKDLKIKGADIMELGIEGGPLVGALLKSALEIVIDEPLNNTKEFLVSYVKSQIENEKI